MKNKTKLTPLFLLAIVFYGCKKEPLEDPLTNVNLNSSNSINGVFITNEGPFVNGSGTVSFYNKENDSIINNITNKNSYLLGNIVQSISVINSKGYIVVNNANKIVIINAKSFEVETEITALTSPRYIANINNSKAYISQYGSVTGQIKVLNLTTNSISKTINTGKGANEILLNNNKAYVACNGGVTGDDSVLTVIDINADTVINYIPVGAHPSELELDADGNIWIMTLGKWNSDYSALEKMPAIVKIDGKADTVLKTFTLTTSYSQPNSLTINANKSIIYYSFDGKIYSQNINSATLNNNALISRNFYSLGVDAETDIIYAGDAGDYSSNGKVVRYTNSGSLIDSIGVGIIPGNFYFYKSN